jgi:SAM-dependent methyltransferase
LAVHPSSSGARGRVAQPRLANVGESRLILPAAECPTALELPISHAYVHGYSTREAERLVDQANTLSELLYSDTRFPAGARVLEAGCGVGAQTVVVAPANPGAHFTSIDLSEASLAEAQRRATVAGLTNVEFRQANLLELPFSDGSFDHVFVCFVLEHMPDPERALTALRRVLVPSGTMTVIEGDHGSALFHPDSTAARANIDSLVRAQLLHGGDANIGRRLQPLLTGAGYRDVRVSPRFVYADQTRPLWVEGFTRLTFNAMVAGAREQVLAAGWMAAEVWDRGMADLERTAGPDGVFCYTFFKATATRA